MVRTRVGYAGGTKYNPTYHQMGDHSETIEIDYDPDVITFKQLLDVFWDSHRADMPPWSRQYMSIIFFHNDAQERLAMESRDLEAARYRKRVFTEILPFTAFYTAEDYHQKYRLRSERFLMEEFSRLYFNEEDFINSTAAARINGYLDGYGSFEELLEESPGFGLSPEAGRKLVEIVKRRKGRIACAS
ncbi:MAG: peptide-methionine (S)-S-oxide reductase [Deltaproteobacteria bacterium]|nr:peptide-methionine (S)-S-oxide reductase [Deltaproteobacteria bacterium]